MFSVSRMNVYLRSKARIKEKDGMSMPIAHTTIGEL